MFILICLSNGRDSESEDRHKIIHRRLISIFEMTARFLLIDGYIDDPAALGVPPYISPMARAVYGAAADAGAEVEYLTVDMIRSGAKIPGADYSAVLSGNTVPGKYLRSLPMSQKELLSVIPKLGGVRIIGGGFADTPNAQRFDYAAPVDMAPVVYDIVSGKIPSNRRRTLDEWNRWMVLGADLVTRHQDFPQPMVVEMETYRGCYRYCSGGCSFCVEPLKGRPLVREPEDILEEAKRLKDLGVRNVRIGGQTCIVSYGSEDFNSGCPVPNPEKADRLFRGLASLCFDSLSVDNANPAVIVGHPEESEEVIRTIAECCSSGNVLAMGLETADPDVQEINNLNCTTDIAMEAIRTVNRIGGERGETGLPKVLPGINLLCGLDGETAATYDMDLEFLREVLDEGLLLRRINIRQVIDARREFGVKVKEKRFHKFKRTVREEIDRPMLEEMLPVGTVLKGVYMELRDGNITFGRQPGSYPLLVGIPYPVELDTSLDAVVIDWGYRSVTAVEYPFDINHQPMSALNALPGIGKKRAAALVMARPFSSFGEVEDVVGDPAVSDILKGIVTLGPTDRRRYR